MDIGVVVERLLAADRRATEQSAARRDEFRSGMERLSQQDRGSALLTIIGFATSVTVLNVVVLGGAARVVWRLVHAADRRPVTLARAAASPALGVAAGAILAQQVGGRIVSRRLMTWVREHAATSGQK